MEIAFGGKDIRGKSMKKFQVHECIKDETRGREATRTKRVSMKEKERGGKREFLDLQVSMSGEWWRAKLSGRRI